MTGPVTPPVQRHDPEIVRAALASWWSLAGVDPIEPLHAPPPRPPEPRDRVRADRGRSAPPDAPRRHAPSPSTAQPAPAAAGRALAARCQTVADLRAVLEAVRDHPLATPGRRLVFARGSPDAPVMVIGEAPGADEDAAGVPFVGRSGQLLDAFFAAIGLTDAAGLYVTNVVYWRPPGNRTPSAEEVALCRPFFERHVALVAPKVLVTVGGLATEALLGVTGITKVRGRWVEYHVKSPDGSDSGRRLPALPMLHPAFLLRRPIAKREAWADMLTLDAHLRGL